MGQRVRLTVLTDSSAAKGMASRRGLGKVRHIEVNQFWVQEKVASGEVELKKIKGTDSLADALTKHVDGEGIVKHMARTGLHRALGGHSVMPELADKEFQTND